METYIPHFPLILKLRIPISVPFALLLLKTEWRLSEDTIAFHLFKFVFFIFPPGIVPVLFQDTTTFFFFFSLPRNVRILWTLFPHDLWQLAKNISNHFPSSSFLYMFDLDGSTAIPSISELNYLLRRLLRIQLCMILFFFSLLHHLTYLYWMSHIKIFHENVFFSFSDP